MTYTHDNHKQNTYQTGHIDVLDGVRAIAILIVVWFHFWQQSWLMPIVGDFNIDWIPRNGALLVDMMILLSGFCLFLPYARSMVYGEPAPNTKTFYIKRMARILPSYYFSLFVVLFLFALPLKEFYSNKFMWKDILTHLFFINNFSYDTLVGTKLNGVLWTVAVEVQFYLIFPLLAKWFQKKPLLTYSSMTLIGLISSDIISKNFTHLTQGFYVNHTLTFFSVFANGMLGAWAYMSVTKSTPPIKAEQFFYVLMTIGGLLLFKILCEHHMGFPNGQQWQVKYRFALSLVYLLILFGVLMTQQYCRFLLGNRFMKFLAGISFNLYIWHQYIAVKLKEFRIPYWEGNTPPNQLDDKPWMWKYMLLCILISLVVAILTTYLIEKPITRWIMKRYNKANQENHPICPDSYIS